MKTRGLALIVVVGILGVLAVLAVAFVAMAELERRASEQRVNAARAYLLARSGIEDALARLALGQDPAYGGEDWNGDAVLDGPEAGNEVFQRGQLNVEDCPARHAMRPSFFAADSLGQPRLAAVEGRDRGYSGALSGDYTPLGNSYTLKAAAGGSEGQGFYINGGDPSVHSNPTATSDYNTNLRRMLGILARAIAEDAAGSLVGPPSGETAGNAVVALTLGESDGWNLVDARPSAGWDDWVQVRDAALGESQVKLEALKPYLTLHAWPDRKVIAPNATEAMLDPNGSAYSPVTGKSEPAKIYHSWGEFKLDHAETRQGSKAPDFERIPIKVGKIVGRAPVDLSWARRNRPALIALLGGLKGLYLDESAARTVDSGDQIGALRVAEVTLDPFTTAVSDICHKVVDRILSSTSELATWQQWRDFCDALPDSVVMSAQDYAVFLSYATADSANPMDDATVSSAEWAAFDKSGLKPRAQVLRFKGQAVRDILKANFNPNGCLNKFGPNASRWRSVDKQDLLAYSTEFSLLPVSYGHQQVSSVGRVLDRRGRLLASRVLQTGLSTPPPVRLTTQKEFHCSGLGSLDIAGDEAGIRLPGEASLPFVTLSRGLSRTWGHSLPGLGGQGVSLQTYPEPMVDDWEELSIHPADYDGSIQLATVETPEDDFYSASGRDPTTGTAVQEMKMLARYTTGFDLDVSTATSYLDPKLHICPKQNHPDFCQVTSNCGGEPIQFNSSGQITSAYQVDQGSPKLEELRNGVLHASKPNTLYPDGCYSERDRAPEYLDRGNSDGFHGVMSFWIKSNHGPPTLASSASLTLWPRSRPFVMWSNLLKSGTQAFFWGGVSAPVCHFEIGHQSSDKDLEHQFRVGRVMLPHRWELLTLRWDFRASQVNDTMEMIIGAGLEATDRGSQSTYAFDTGNAPALAEDITADDRQRDGSIGPHRISLGQRREPFYPPRLGYGADATFDEFVLYDFGGAGYDSQANPESTPASADTCQSPRVLALNRFREGRYYKESVYGGLGAPGNTAAEWFSAPIFLGDAVRIRGLSWTQIVPRDLPAAAISFELVDETGTAYALDLGGNQPLTDPTFSPVNRSLRGAFRLHAIFQPNLADPENTPILDPLALDDVTVLYEPLGGPAVLAWDSDED